MPYTTDAERWRALATRDAAADGHFIYSVISTHIYCRPTCPGRLARRANVGFYKTTSEAEAAGFRACKRCKPNAVLEDPQERAVEKACLLIDDGLKNNDPKAFRLQDLAKKVGLTPRYFHKVFKDRTGLTPKEYAKSKMTAQNSPASASDSTSNECNAQVRNDELRCDELFDFNDLVDFDPDLSPTWTDDCMLETASLPTPGSNTNINVNSLLPTWDEGQKSNGIDIGLDIVDGNLFDLFDVMSASLPLEEGNAIQAMSSFELDAAVILGSSGIGDVLSPLPIYQ
ncbi:hypothetical protein IQ07DRAFT_583209 [Pyrenochaeta sp. DS3sAY3a]|nr:hypothetical protein IQ07DRAFT_583209 [Pyrenochaeta sp. DS3sAY3a]